MTEAIATNNYDILNSAQISTDTVAAVTPVAEVVSENSSNFTSILDDKIKTIGDLKNSSEDIEIMEKFASFKEILADATNEANLENSLDLTLARDINDIISQLKGAVEETPDTQDESVIDTSKDDLSIKDMVEAAAPVVFEQVLTLVDKAVNAESTGLAKEIVDEVKDFVATKFEDEIIAKDIEEITIDTDIEPTEKELDTLDSHIDKDMLRELNIESVKAETDSSDNGSLMDRQTPEEHGVKVMLEQNIEKFDSNLDKAVNNTANITNAANTKTLDVNPSKIIEQITKQLEGMQNNSKVSIVLNPAALGKVNLQIVNTPEGLSAQFTVTTNEAREILAKGLEGLKEMLSAQGVGVDNISVKLNEAEKSSYNPDWTDREGSNGGNKGQGQPRQQEKQKGLFEKTIAKTINKENGNV